MEQNNTLDEMVNFVMLVTILAAITWIFLPYDLISLSGSVLAIISIIFYSRRILLLADDIRTPFADSLFVLAGINVSLYMLHPLVSFSILTAFRPINSLILLVLGVISKSILLDEVLMEALKQLKDSVLFLLDWAGNSIINFVRIILTVLAIGCMILSNLIDSQLGANWGFSLFYLLLATVILMSSLHHWDGRFIALRIVIQPIIIIVAVIMHIFYSPPLSISFEIFTIAIILWGISIPSFIKYQKYILEKITYYFTYRTMLSFQVLSGLLSIVSLIFLPTTLVTNIPINLLGFALFFLFAIHSLIIDFFIWLIPLIKNFIINTVEVIRDNLFFFSQVSAIILALVSYFFYLAESQIIYLIIAVLLVIYAFHRLIKQLLIWFYHTSIRTFQWGLAHPRASWYIIFSITSLLSFIFIPRDDFMGFRLNSAVGLLLLFITGFPIYYDFTLYIIDIWPNIIQFLKNRFDSVDKITPWLSIMIFGFSSRITGTREIILVLYALATIFAFISWNALLFRFYDHILGVAYFLIYNMIHGIWRITRFFFRLGLLEYVLRALLNLFKSMYRNIFLLILWSLALFFVLLGVGLFIPFIFPPSSLIFTAILENTLVKLIVGTFLIGIGGLTFKEVTERRSRFQLEVKS
ncbi:MAG: hypothetical protein INQ03_13055 [Candidatus Heimdallarchaeota archaeon]|nr:hypothetical protein [Candidatus Heimdallarchaeota archaeon]